MPTTTTCTAFAGSTRIASGTIEDVAVRVKGVVDADDPRSILIFDDATSAPIELDLRGSVEDVRRAARSVSAGSTPPAASATPGSPRDGETARRRSPGRPKLGVVGREVTLLPRHWAWLNAQPGGASVALRKLVDAARRVPDSTNTKRHAQEAAFRFMSAIAGNEAGYEEATRALFAGDAGRFDEHTRGWPADVRDHAARLASGALE